MVMAARAIWKAEICLDKLKVPVKLFSAVQDTAIHFRLLDKRELTPVTQHMVDAANHKSVVPSDAIQRAVQVEPGLFVVVTKEEQEKLEPAPSRDIVIEQVVDRSHVDDRWFDRPYYLGPDGETERYFALAEALADDDRLAIARWTMRKQRYAGAVYVDQDYLMISTFRHAEELARIDRIKPDPHRAPDKKELDLADQLISALADTFDPHAFHDEYRDRVMELVRTKAAGKTVRYPKRKRQPSTEGGLLQSLEASVNQARRGAHASKAAR
jgi:DNA end-binding protein Ku